MPGAILRMHPTLSSFYPTRERESTPPSPRTVPSRHIRVSPFLASPATALPAADSARVVAIDCNKLAKELQQVGRFAVESCPDHFRFTAPRYVGSWWKTVILAWRVVLKNNKTKKMRNMTKLFFPFSLGHFGFRAYYFLRHSFCSLIRIEAAIHYKITAEWWKLQAWVNWDPNHSRFVTNREPSDRGSLQFSRALWF